jgi:protein-tyrosine phosphatase
MTVAQSGHGELINFRDFGGCLTQSGRSVRRDRLYRSGHFADAAANSFSSVIQLDFEVIVDLRDLQERNTERSAWPATYADRVITHDRNPLGVAPHLGLLRGDMLTPDGVERYYGKLYAELPFDPSYRPLFARAIQRLATADGRVLIHCAVGKDRTGILCALVLSSLQVDREAIMADYMRSSKSAGLVEMKSKVFAWARKQHGHEISEPAVDALLDVRPCYLEAAFARIEDECGSVANYLAASGVAPQTTERLRECLLET